MNLSYLYTRRMLKNMFRKQSLVTLIILLALVVGISLTISFAPLTPPTRESLRRLAESYFKLPANEYSIALAFFAIEFPPFIALFASVIVAIIPQKVILYERASGNMEILLSAYSDMRKVAQALMISSLIVAGVIYLIFMLSGVVAILIYELIYNHFFIFPSVFYMFLFVLDPILIVLAVSIALLFTITFPALSSIETYALSSNPLQIIAYLPSLLIILVITFIPMSPRDLAIYITPAAVGVLAITLFFAKKTMRRDVLVRK